MNVSVGPGMTELLSLLGGMQGRQGTGSLGAGDPGMNALSALAPLLQGLTGTGGGGPDLGSLAALAPLLQSMAGRGISQPRRGMSQPGRGMSPPRQGAGQPGPETAASDAPDVMNGGEQAAGPVIDVEPRPAAAEEPDAQTGPAREVQEPPPESSSRGSRKRPRGFGFDPALLSLLTSLGGASRPRAAGPQPQPDAAPREAEAAAEEEFDPCAACLIDCPRRNPSLSFGQAQALAATFPAYI